MADFGLKVAAAVRKGRALKRVTSGGEEKCQEGADPTVATGEKFIGFSTKAFTDATTNVKMDIAGPGDIVLAETGAAIVVGNHYLMYDAQGRVIVSDNRATKLTVALNIFGETAAGAGEYIRVLVTSGLQ